MTDATETTPLTVRIPIDLKRRATRHASAVDRPLASLIRVALADYLDRAESRKNAPGQ